jgi:hypothetical protein
MPNDRTDRSALCPAVEELFLPQQLACHHVDEAYWQAILGKTGT